MGTERCCRGLAGNWDSTNVYVGILSGSEHLSGNALPRNARRAETAKRSVADRSWKELALALSLAIHYAWGMLSYF